MFPAVWLINAGYHSVGVGSGFAACHCYCTVAEGYRTNMWERSEFPVLFHLLQDRTNCREAAIDSFGEMGKDGVLEWSKRISQSCK